MTCSSCGNEMAEHCAVHLVPCCPGKCAGEEQFVTLMSGGPAEEGHVVGYCHCGYWHGYCHCGYWHSYRAVPTPPADKSSVPGLQEPDGGRRGD